MARHGCAELGTLGLDSIRAREIAFDGEGSRIDGISGPNESEPISPELVLVDPELARSSNRRLFDRARPRARGPVLAPASFPERLPSRRVRDLLLGADARVVTVPLVASVFAVGLLAAHVVSPSLAERPGQAPSRATTPRPPVPVGAPTAPRQSTATHGQRTSAPTLVPRHPTARAPAKEVAPTRPRRDVGAAGSVSEPVRSASRPRMPRSTTLRESRATVERRVLSLVVRSPAGKLPDALIDPETGLAENNLQAVCRPSGESSFLCVVRPARHEPNEGLYVVYRPGRNGEGVFRWQRYRSG